MDTIPNVCERCGKQRLRGKYYTFWYGGKIGESTQYKFAMRVQSNFYSFAGEQRTWLCDSCVLPRKWLLPALVAPFFIFTAISPFLGIWNDTASKVCWGGFGLALLGYLVNFIITEPNDTGERMAIRIHKKRLKKEGYNTFVTTHYYNSLKKKSS
jgi:hypothetical protein